MSSISLPPTRPPILFFLIFFISNLLSGSSKPVGCTRGGGGGGAANGAKICRGREDLVCNVLGIIDEAEERTLLMVFVAGLPPPPYMSATGATGPEAAKRRGTPVELLVDGSQILWFWSPLTIDEAVSSSAEP
jgi:hypothetical protein